MSHAAVILTACFFYYVAFVTQRFKSMFNTSTWAGDYANPELISMPLGDRAACWKAASDAAGLPTFLLFLFLAVSG